MNEWVSERVSETSSPKFWPTALVFHGIRANGWEWKKPKIEIVKKTPSPYDLNLNDNLDNIITQVRLKGDNYEEWLDKSYTDLVEGKKKVGICDTGHWKMTTCSSRNLVVGGLKQNHALCTSSLMKRLSLLVLVGPAFVESVSRGRRVISWVL